ncbi:hypothetical protein D3C80_1779880 [compost metagenome]
MARAQCNALLQHGLPDFALARLDAAVANIGELDQLDTFVAGQDDSGFTQGFTVQGHTHHQGHIKEMLMKVFG